MCDAENLGFGLRDSFDSVCLEILTDTPCFNFAISANYIQCGNQRAGSDYFSINQK